MLSSAAIVLSGLVYSVPLTLVGLIAAMLEGTLAHVARLFDHGEVRLVETAPVGVQPVGKSDDCSSAWSTCAFTAAVSLVPLLDPDPFVLDSAAASACTSACTCPCPAVF